MKTDIKLYLNSQDNDIVGFKVKNNFYVIGPSNYVNSWFSNIQLLEYKGLFSKKTHLISHDLYLGKLRLVDIPKAQKELAFIIKKFKNTPLSSIIWDIKDTNAIPVWPVFVDSEKAGNLYDFYINMDGQNLIEIASKAMEQALALKWDLIINQMFCRPDMQVKADQDK